MHANVTKKLKKTTKPQKMEPNKIALFEGKTIRKLLHNDEWWFSVIDVVNLLEVSSDARNYWKVLKNRLKKEGSDQTVTNCNWLKLFASDGKMCQTDCSNTEKRPNYFGLFC